MNTHRSELVPELPPPFELIMLAEVDSVLDEAARRAQAGAEEGTVLIAESQRAACTRRGFGWEAPRGNLHCALVLRPEFPNARAEQLCLVGAVAAGAALAEVVAPMTGLGFGWPNDLLLNGLRAGRVQLAAPGGGHDPWPWLVVELSVNVAHHPAQTEPEQFNSVHASGDADHVRVVEIAELFCRHFLRWINRWDHDGFAPVRAAWAQRAAGLGERREVELSSRRVAGVARGIGEHGELLIDCGSDSVQPIRIGEYFGLG